MLPRKVFAFIIYILASSCLGRVESLSTPLSSYSHRVVSHSQSARSTSWSAIPLRKTQWPLPRRVRTAGSLAQPLSSMTTLSLSSRNDDFYQDVTITGAIHEMGAYVKSDHDDVICPSVGFKRRLLNKFVGSLRSKGLSRQKRSSPVEKNLQFERGCGSEKSGNSLFGQKQQLSTEKRQARKNMVATNISSLLFLLLRKASLNAPLVAWASSTTSTATTLSRPFFLRSYILSQLSNLLNLLPTRQNILTFRTLKRFIISIITVLALLTLKENLAAIARQRVDATSEWGRYADQPSARGLALTLLLVRLIPYAILPQLIEKFKLAQSSSSTTPSASLRDNPNYLSSQPHKLRQRGGQIFADGLLRLGPLYIKIGQILSCRENLFPSEWISAMEKLQDRVPAKSGKEAWDLLYEACPGGKKGFHRTFSDFDDVPLAAASLGQVHRARLRENGEAVAIKIQRARLRDIYDKDLALMNQIAQVVDRFGGAAGKVGGVEQSWVEIFKDAEEILYREIDYRDEAENAIRFANDFGLGLGGTSVTCTAKSVDGKRLESASEWLRVPYTYGDLSSEKFLVMEYVPSIKISNNAKLDAAGVTAEDREYLAESLARSYLRQFVNRFFSTDPHPGNLGVEVFENEDRPPRLVFYDFGQACSLSKDQSLGILEVIESIIDLDAKRSVSAFSRMGVLKDNADLDKVLAKVQNNYDTGKLKVKKRKKRKSARYQKGAQQSSMKETRPSDLETARPNINANSETADDGVNSTEAISPEKEDPEVMEYFTLQSEYAFVARALSQMDGVGKGLDKEFDFISAAAPYLVEVKGAGKYLIDEAKKKLTFVYDKENGLLAREMELFKMLGFDPDMYKKNKK